jgi:hypothetical protein
MADPKALDQYSVEELRAELKAREAHQPPSEPLHDFSTAAILEVLRRKETALYGAAAVLDLYQLEENNPLLQDADSVVALFDQDDVQEQGETAWLQTRPFGTAYNLCSSEQFQEQPTGAFGAGCLVAPDIITTAGKLVSEQTLARVRFVFGFRMQNEQTPVTQIRTSEIYQGVSILGREANDSGPDWALVRLDRPVMGHRIARVRSAGKVGDSEELHVIGHPLGLPAKVASGARVTENTAAGYFSANLAVYGGDFGSPVFNSQTHEVEGILVRGETAFVANGTCQVALVRPSTGCSGRECTRVTEFARQVPQWRDWVSHGRVWMSALAIPPRSPDLFQTWVLGVDHHAWHCWFAGAQADDHKGIGVSLPAVVIRGGRAWDVFMVGPDSALYHLPLGEWTWTGTARLGGAWDAWETLGGICNSPPAVVSWDIKRLDVFVLGSDHAVIHQAWDGSAWSGWNSLGGAWICPPTVCSWGVNRLDVFVLGTDHALYHQAWDGSAWSGWKNVGGEFVSPPAVVSRGPGLLDAFVLGTNSALYHQAWDGSAWGGWNSLGGTWTSPPSAVSWGATASMFSCLVLIARSTTVHGTA